MESKTEHSAPEQTSSPDQELSRPGRRLRGRPALGRRGQRGKRRGRKGRGLKEKKGRGLKEKRRGQEKKEGVTVKRTWSDGGKRRWDKKHYCVFCRRPQVKIARHLLTKHADQQEVAAAGGLPPRSKQRHLLLEHLRCRGNYMHNIEVIRQGSGEIVPWRQPSEDVDARNYLPCPLCLGFFLRADLWKHQASCRRKLTSDPSRDSTLTPDSTRDPEDSTTAAPANQVACDPGGHAPTDPSEEKNPTDLIGTKRPLTSDPVVDLVQDPPVDRPRKRTRVQAAASRLLPISSGASESCSEVLHRMNQDHVSYQVKSDWLICKFGNKLLGSEEGGQRRYDYVSQKLRELGRLVLAAKSLDPGVQTLQDVLAPGNLSLALAAAKKASGYRWSRPPLAVKTTLKTVCEIAIGESLQDGDWEAAARTTDFYHLLGKEWDDLWLLHPDKAAPAGGAKAKRPLVQSKGGKESTQPDQDQSNPRPEVLSLSSNRPVPSMIPPESRLQPPPAAPVTQRKVQRRPWSTAEKEAVWRQLGVHVLVQSVPGKEVCQRCLDLEPVLRGRHWKDVKNQVHNQIQSQKKQQFHAQMDLQHNQDQQDPVQNQRKSQCQDNTQNHKKQQYQVQSDQHIQNKKKQQHLIHMDNQDHKKQQYRTQLENQDPHQVHKKQLGQPRVDHQDGVQVHKKQLYQMGQQTQGLQPNLDRDPSLLTSPPYGPDGPHQGPGQSLLERDPPTIAPYAVPHRTLGPHMDQLLSRPEWSDQALVQHYTLSRQLDRNLVQDGPPGGPLPGPHPGHVHF